MDLPSKGSGGENSGKRRRLGETLRAMLYSMPVLGCSTTVVVGLLFFGFSFYLYNPQEN